MLCGLSWEKMLCSSQRKRRDGRVRMYLTDEPGLGSVGTGVKRVAALVVRGLGPSFLPWSEVHLNLCRYKRLWAHPITSKVLPHPSADIPVICSHPQFLFSITVPNLCLHWLYSQEASSSPCSSSSYINTLIFIVTVCLPVRVLKDCLCLSPLFSFRIFSFSFPNKHIRT